MGMRCGKRQQKGTWAYCNLCPENAQQRRSTRMPKRNQRESANTRFYLDINKDLFYEVFTDLEWDPTNDKMAVRRRSDHWEKLFGTKDSYGKSRTSPKRSPGKRKAVQ